MPQIEFFKTLTLIYLFSITSLFTIQFLEIQIPSSVTSLPLQTGGDAVHRPLTHVMIDGPSKK